MNVIGKLKVVRIDVQRSALPQPCDVMQVVLDTVEIILGPGSAANQQDDEDPDQMPTPSSEADQVTGGSGSWLGSGASWLGLRALALRAGLNICISLKNVLVKYVHHDGCVLTAALENLGLANCAPEEWQDGVDNAEAWLAKKCSIKGLSLVLDFADAVDGGYLPLLRLSMVRVSALLPIFAFAEGVGLGKDAPRVAIDVHLGKVSSAINDAHIRWASGLMQRSSPDPLLEEAGASAPSLELPAAGGATPLAAEGNGVANLRPSAEEAGACPQPHDEMKALGVFSKIWYLMVDEATYIQNLEPGGVGESSSSGRNASFIEGNAASMALGSIPMHAELTAQLDGISVQLGGTVPPELHEGSPAELVIARPTVAVAPYLEFELGATRLYSASAGSQMRAVQAEVERLTVRHAVTTSSQGTAVSTNERCWDEVLGLYPWQSPQAEPAKEEARPEYPSAAFFKWSCAEILATEDAEPGCALQLGQVWAAYSHQMWCDLGNYLRQPLSSGQAVPLSENSARETPLGSPRAAQNKAWWTQTGPVALDIGLLQLAAVSPVLGAGIVLHSEGAIYHSSAAEALLDGMPSNLNASVTLSVVNGGWETCASRAEKATVAGAEPVGRAFTVAGCYGAEIRLRLSPLVLEFSNAQVDAIMACFRPDQPRQSLLAETSTLQLALPGGIDIEYSKAGGTHTGHGSTPQVRCSHVAVCTKHELPEANAVVVQLDMYDLICCAAPESSVSIATASVQCQRNLREGTCDRPVEPPLLFASQLQWRSNGDERALSLSSMNIHAGPAVFVDLAAVLGQSRSGVGSAAPTDNVVDTGSLEPASEQEHASAPLVMSVDMATFTLVPPPLTPGHPGPSWLGLSGWFASLERRTSPQGNQVSLGAVEVSLRMLGASGQVELHPFPVLRYGAVQGRGDGWQAFILHETTYLASSFPSPGAVRRQAQAILRMHLRFRLSPTAVQEISGCSKS